MSPSDIPERHSSKERAAVASMKAWTERQDLLAQRSVELKKKLSTTSSEHTPEDTTRLKIADYENDKAMTRHETSYFEMQAAKGALDKKALKAQRITNTNRIISLGDAQWQQSKALREFQEGKGLASPINPDYERAFNAALLNLYKDPSSSKVQHFSNLRDDTIAKYNSAQTPDCQRLWCPILKCYDLPSNRRAAHIVPHAFPREFADFWFGPDSAPRIDSTDNCMLMSRLVERHFDKHHFVIIPVDANEKPLRRWKIVVTSEDCRSTEVHFNPESGVSVCMDDLDGQELVFKNDARPAARFLYYHFLVSIMLCRDKQAAGHERLMSLVSGKPFATWGKWLRKSVMVGMARQLGDLDAEFEELSVQEEPYPDNRSLSPDEESEIARRVLKASLAREEEEEEKEEEGED